MPGPVGQISAGDTVASGVMQLDPGEHVDDLAIRLWRAGEIAGTVTDAGGDPLLKASIVCW